MQDKPLKKKISTAYLKPNYMKKLMQIYEIKQRKPNLNDFIFDGTFIPQLAASHLLIRYSGFYLTSASALRIFANLTNLSIT